MEAGAGFRGAMTFLTRVPLGAGGHPAAALPWFPVVGALVGAVVTLVFVAAGEFLGPLVAAGLGVAAGIALTGGLHEDGLGDVADAFVGGHERADVLRILDDPRQGTFGVIAIALSVLLRTAALAELDPWSAVVALPSAHALGRAAAVGLVGLGPPAGGGLGSSFGAAARRGDVWWAVGIGLLVAALLMGARAAPAALLATAAVFWLARLARKKAGGITGDVLGAAEQATEIAVLLVAAAAGAVSPWWMP